MELLDTIESKNHLLQVQEKLLESQRHIRSELETAAGYLESLLPPSGQSVFGINCDWIFQPSTDLGGDCFGFHKLDEENVAIYVIDVCDHGVGAALLSVTLMHLLRSQGFWRIDFTNPIEVLHGLNKFFYKKTAANSYFTIWYGVYNNPKNRLTFSNGGHPPAILVPSDASLASRRLYVPGIAIGCSSEASFSNSSCPMHPGDTLWVFSDGAFEFTKSDGGRQNMNNWIQSLDSFSRPSLETLEPVANHLKELHGSPTFDDDVCVLRLRFPTSQN